MRAGTRPRPSDKGTLAPSMSLPIRPNRRPRSFSPCRRQDAITQAIGGRIVLASVALALAFSLGPLLPERQAYADEAQRIAFDGVGLEASSPLDALFDGFGTIFPGETKTGDVVLANESSEPCVFYLRVAQEPTTNRADAAEAPVRMKLSLSTEGAELYQGDLRGEALREGAILGYVDPGDSLDLSFTIEAPADMGNEFALSSLRVPWTFAAQQIIPQTNPTDGKPSPTTSGSLPQTGDAGATIAIAALAGAALAAGAVALIARKTRIVPDDEGERSHHASQRP